jgi:hypothetical protein
MNARRGCSDVEREALIGQDLFLDDLWLQAVRAWWRCDCSLLGTRKTFKARLWKEQLTLDAHDILLLLLVTLRLRLLNAQSINVFEHARLKVHRFDLRGQEREPCGQEALNDQTAHEGKNAKEEMRCKSQAARKDRDLNCQLSSLMGARFCSRLTVSSLLPSSLPDKQTCSDV